MASNRNLLVLPGDGIGPEVMNEVRKIITWMGKKRAVGFDIDPFRKHCLLNGLDDIGLTMEKKSEIDDFEQKQKESQPWLHAAE